VPTIQTYDVSGPLYIYGSGFVEGSMTASFAGGEQKDTATNVQPSPGADIYDWNGSDNGTMRLEGEPVHGFGPLTVTTAGGTSAPFALNELTQVFGNLRDVAFDPTTKSAWVSDLANPAKLHRIDLATGAELQSITLSDKDFGSGYMSIAGLQITPEAFTLNGASIPVGSLLVFNGQPNPDWVTALNPADGTVISSFNAPLWGDEAGLAIDPVTGNLWMGSYNAPDQSTLIEMTRTGTEVRRVNVASQGINDQEISGLAFDDTGKLLVSSTQGRIYRVTL